MSIFLIAILVAPKNVQLHRYPYHFCARGARPLAVESTRRPQLVRAERADSPCSPHCRGRALLDMA